MDTVEGDGVAATAAKQWDLFIPCIQPIQHCPGVGFITGREAGLLRR